MGNILHAQDTELAVIGIAMDSADGARQVADLPDDMFSTPGTQAAHRAIRRMVSAGQQIDLITLSAETAKEAPSPEEMLLAALQAGGGMPSFLPQWTAILDDRRKRRALSGMASKVLKAVIDPAQDPQTLTEMATGWMQVTKTESGAICMQ